MRKVDLAYIAGLLDGEGSICILKTKSTGYVLTAFISNTNCTVLQWIQMTLGFGRVDMEMPRIGHLGHKPMYKYG